MISLISLCVLALCQFVCIAHKVILFSKKIKIKKTKE